MSSGTSEVARGAMAVTSSSRYYHPFVLVALFLVAAASMVQQAHVHAQPDPHLQHHLRHQQVSELVAKTISLVVGQKQSNVDRSNSSSNDLESSEKETDSRINQQQHQGRGFLSSSQDIRPRQQRKAIARKSPNRLSIPLDKNWKFKFVKLNTIIDQKREDNNEEDDYPLPPPPGGLFVQEPNQVEFTNRIPYYYVHDDAPEAQIDFNYASNSQDSSSSSSSARLDESWMTIPTIPHDPLMLNAPSKDECPHGCSGNSYIPRYHGLWYRKTIQIPIGDGKDIVDDFSWYLRFDGSFRNTTVWINGDLVVRGHECGYTPFTTPVIDLRSSLQSESKSVHATGTGLGGAASDGTTTATVTIAVFVDPSNGDRGSPESGSGWWYEGGGLYRRVWLERRLTKVYIEDESLFVKSKPMAVEIEDTAADTSTPHTQTTILLSRRLDAAVEVSATVIINQSQQTLSNLNTDVSNDVCFHIVVENEQQTVHSTPSKRLMYNDNSVTLAALGRGHEEDGRTNIQVKIRESFDLSNITLWSLTTPYLYRVRLALTDCTITNKRELETKTKEILDSVEVTHGIRTLRFDADHGFFLNDELETIPNSGDSFDRDRSYKDRKLRSHFATKSFKLRGFCDHDNFGVLGGSLPPRLHLYRAQALRAIGGNSRRTSHNPPDPAMLDIHDRLGILTMDENRLFDNQTKYIDNFRTLVKRDRNHPSVFIYSFCNELGCEGVHEVGGPAFQQVAEQEDGTRPTLANMFTFHDLLGDTVDIQGFSHRHRETLEQCHAEVPMKPIIQSECCSCNTMRGQEADTTAEGGCETTDDNPHDECLQISFAGRCLENLVNASDGVAWAAGTYVWTLTDYYGEPPYPGRDVSSTYGQYDLCGYVKASASWFRMQWLLGVDDGSIDKPFSTHEKYEVNIVESWEPPVEGRTSRTIHVYSNAPVVELFVNSKSFGRRYISLAINGTGSYAEWLAVPWEAGNLTVMGFSRINELLSASPLPVAFDSKVSSGQATRINLVLDCPSPVTGTGEELWLDGQDVALVRAEVVDDEGQVVVLGRHNITFHILDGPGIIQGAASGNASSYESHVTPWSDSYHGLVRGVIRVTSLAGLSEITKHWMGIIDPTLKDDDARTGDILIQATSPGLTSSSVLRIPTSTDPETGALHVAQRLAGQPVDFGFSSRN